MNRLLYTLHKGVALNDIPDAFLPTVETWLTRGFIKQHDATITLDTRYRLGRINIFPNGKGVVTPFEDLPPLHIDPKHIYRAHPGDTVLVQRLFGKGSRGMVVDVAESAFTYSVGYLKKGEQGLHLVNIKQEAPITLFHLEQLQPYEEGSLFLIDNRDNSVIRTLGNLADPAVDEAVSLALFNRSSEFEESVMHEIEGFAKTISVEHYPERKNLTALPFCTIDPDTAKDFDDAIYFNSDTHTLYVAIADVSSYVKPDTALDAEALNRGFSVYFPHKSVPMLPRLLSENLCSLAPHVNRLAFVCEMQLDSSSLEVTKHTFYEAVIHSQQRFTYSEIDTLLEGAKSPYKEQWGSTITTLHTFTQQLRKKRLQKGFDFRTEEVSMQLDDAGLIQSTRIEDDTASHQLVEECMLLANIAAAHEFERGIFRVHEEPNAKKLEILYEELAGVGIQVKELPTIKATITAIQKEAEAMQLAAEVDELIIRSQMQAKYSESNGGHFGLGFERYTHFTSPIRRYSDLIVHRLIKALRAHDKTQSEALSVGLEESAERISQLEREASTVESDFKHRKYARWAATHAGEHVKGRITSTYPSVQAHMHDVIEGATIQLAPDTQIALFSNVTLEIERANIATGRIYGKIVGAEPL